MDHYDSINWPESLGLGGNYQFVHNNPRCPKNTDGQILIIELRMEPKG